MRLARSKRVDKHDWHVWFAWHPVATEKNYIWLEPVLRKAVEHFFDTYTYNYREYDE